MACQLYAENDLVALYSIVYGEIKDRMDNPDLAPFNNIEFNKFIKEVYKEFKDEPNGLLYAQAVPDILIEVAKDPEVRTYLKSKAVDFKFDPVYDLSVEWDNIDKVLEFVQPKRIKTNKKQIDSKIKQSNRESKAIPQKNDNGDIVPWSSVQEKAKVDNPLKLSGQIAVAKNPETMTEQERNEIDNEKVLFDKVIKNVVWLSRNKTETDKVMLGDTPIMLKAQSIRSLDKEDLTEYDATFLTKNKTYNINVGIISDRAGNPIRFDDAGNVTETGGRIVYQYIRPVVNYNSKLYLGNRAGYLYSLISPQDLVKQEIKNALDNGKIYSQEERDAAYAKYKNMQTQNMNDLQRLNEALELEKDAYVLLPIVGGSYGIVEKKSELLSNTDFKDDVEMIYIHDTGMEGVSYFMTSKISSGVAIDNKIYLQRMDIDEKIARNIAKILTTDLLSDGEPLSPQAKLEYYETFLSNQTSGNGITVELIQVLNQNKLSVSLYDRKTKQSESIDLESEDAENKIFNHLMKVKEFTDSQGNITAQYPASMSYMRKFAVDGAIQKGVTFTDYEFTTNRSGNPIIRKVEKDYFDFIKPYMKVDYSKPDMNYFAGLNSYLQFAVPYDFTTQADDFIELGMPYDDSLVLDEVDAKPIKKAKETEEGEEEKGFKLSAFASKLPNGKVLVSNMNKADIVLGLGTDFTMGDEKIIQQRASKEKKWHSVILGSKKDAPKGFNPSDEAIDLIVKNLSAIRGNIINVVGNDIAALYKKGYTQEDVDKYIYNILSKVSEKYPISKIISNGQTGIAEASIKAAKKLGIPVDIIAFKDYALKTSAPYLTKGYQNSPNTKSKFLSRFYNKKSAEFKRKTTKVEKPVDTSTKIAKVVKPKLTKEEIKVVDAKINKMNIDNLLDGLDLSMDFPDVTLDRNKRQTALMTQIYGDKASWNEVLKWWESSPLKNEVSLERLSLIYNSDAYGTFIASASKLSEVISPSRKKGFLAKIELYGDALPITLYHESWHAFSQLVLTREEKTKLYDEVRNYPKWETLSYKEVEEELAEGFIEYLVDGKKAKGFIQRVYDKFKKILEFFFGKTSNRDITRLYDIPLVKEYYDKLHTGNFTIDTENAANNLMPGFERLNSAKNTVTPLDDAYAGYNEITDSESSKIVDLLDVLMARTFQQYNTRYNTTSGAVKLLSNVTNRQSLYTTLEKQVKALLEKQHDVTREIAQKNVLSNDPDYILEQKHFDRLNLLTKIVQNYGVIGEALSKKTDKGVVAFHMKRSRFSVLKDAYVDETEDPTTTLFSTKEGNSISAKQLATDDTTMMLSGIFKLKRKNNEDYLLEKDANGVENYVYDTDEFGLPILEPMSDMWNRVARTLQGSFDYQDMHDRLTQGIPNNPEFIQILNMLPNPYVMGPGAYNNKTEFQSETNFWQDLKKPVIPYIQLNINKTIIEKQKYVDGKRIPEKSKFESRLAAANFDVYKIINDWTTNFNIADTATNPYIVKDKKYGFNILDVDKIINDFSLNKQLDPTKAVDFLAALGIQMDMTSAEIRAVVRDKKKPFAAKYNIDFIYNNIRLVYLSAKSNDISLNAAANDFKKDPMYYLLNGLPSAIEKAAGDKSRDVKNKVTRLAELQNRFSDGYSNFSVLTPEKNKVWEQFVDNTITRVVTSIKKAKNWQELTSYSADPNGRFQHMKWLNEVNNPASPFSMILNSIFDLNQMSETYGEKLPGAELLLENIGGTQIINRETNDSTGTSTASTDVTSKFLQELHTMLQSGVQEFMRHASKQTAMNIRAKKLKTYAGKKSSNLYVDVMAFSPKNTVADNNQGETESFNIILGYIAAEAGRIFRFKSSPNYFKNFTAYNRDVVRKDTGNTVMAGEAFTAFDDVLTPETQGLLYDIIDKNIEEVNNEALNTGYYNTQDFNLKEIINENPDLRKKVKADVIRYFNTLSEANYSRLEDAKYVDQSLYDMVKDPQISKDLIDKMLVKAYTYNSWIHNFETTILAYGDTVQYNHDKEEFHKRNAGLGSGGRSFRADLRARMYINSPLFEKMYAAKQGYQLEAYNGTLNTAIIKEEVIKESKYKPEYSEALIEDYTKRYIAAGKSKKEATRLAKELSETVLKDYSNMKIADGQGWINFEAYRMLKNLEGNWTYQQEDLYKKIVKGDIITGSDIQQFFPPYKLQYYGNIKTEGLPVVSFHKFSLAPIIPTVHTADTKLGQIHDMMLKQNVHYVLMETGEKVGHIGNGDEIIDKNGNVDTSVEFTKNVVFAEFLKNQTEVNSKYKEKSIFSTQMRKMILEGLYENGEITSKDPKVIALVNNYVDRVSAYTELLKNELTDELGFKVNEAGEYIPVDKDSIAKLAKMIRDTLTRDDVYSDKLIDIIDVTEEGELRFDLSLHPEAAKIEKLLLSVINKRIIKQKVKGEPLVQKSSGFYDGLINLELDLDKMNPAARDAAVKKYMGSNFLPTYHKGADGKTTAMKVAISLQGDYENLLNLEYKGEPISTIDRLNEAIKDDEWLDGNNGSNRKAITMVGVRIPVQGLNSMEFMEIYHFLPPQAGNIIIPPAEIVAKSGADFDIDKLSIFMTSIDPEGNIKKSMFEKSEDFYEALKDPSKYDMTKEEMYATQKAGLENELINDIRSILELPQNFVSLITPNGTYLVKPIADELAEYVMDYNPLQNIMSNTPNLSAPDKNGKQKEVISPTRIFEAGYNLYKHESNVVGKRTLGLGAIENTFNVIFNSLGAVMPAVYMHSNEKEFRKSFLGLRHHKTTKNGEDVISISNIYDVDGNNKVADIISQLMNGWVDVEKDAWVFFVQGNYEVAPILLYLLKTGVPVREAIYFVSQPLVRQYVKERRLINSTFAEPLRKSAKDVGVPFKAATNVIARNFDKMLPDDLSRYTAGEKMLNIYFDANEREGDDRHFTEEEMLNLIKDSKDNPEKAMSSLSRTMFLHYLTIEKQIEGITRLKMAANPDTALDTDIGQVIQAESDIDELAAETKIDPDLRTGMLYDSIISSFFNTKMVKGLAKPLFKFRYDEDIQDYIQNYLSDFTNTAALKTVFGKMYREKFPIVFRNDILSYLFQNAVRKYSLDKEYSSYNLKDSISVTPAAGLKFGAFVTEEKGVPTVVVDKVQIEKEFFDKAYLEGSEAQNSYESRGLFPLKPGHFGKNTPSNKEEYLRFVIEREYLRHVMPMAEIVKSQEFKKELINTKKTSVISDESKNRRYTYEKILTSRALDNTLNPYHLFYDNDQAYSIRLDRIKTMYKNDFVGDYPVLSRMIPDINNNKTMFNFYLDDKDMNSFKSNTYTQNLKDLGDRNVIKVKDKTENDRISDFFSNITYVAMMQSGTNKSKYNMINITDFDKFLEIMNQETAKFLTSPNKIQLLVDFKNKFEKTNSQANRDRYRFKNYLTGLNVDKSLNSNEVLPLPPTETDETGDQLEEPMFQLKDARNASKAIKELDDYLLKFVKQFGVQSKEFETLKDKLGVDALGATDVLNKLIWYTKDRNAETIPEEVGHMLVMLMGPNHKAIKQLSRNITTWDEYDSVYAEYMPLYKNEEQVKIEAMGKLISKSLVSNYEAAGLDKSLIKTLIKAIEDLILKMLKNFAFFQTMNYNARIADHIALNVLAGNTEYIADITEKRPKLNYDEAVKNNPLAKKIIDTFAKDLKFPLVGSLAIAGQGEVIYRPSDEPIHDLDFLVDGTNQQNLENLEEALNLLNAVPVHFGWSNTNKGFTTYAYYIPKPGYTVEVTARNKQGWALQGAVIVKDSKGNKVDITADTVIPVDFFTYENSKPNENTINIFSSWNDIYKGKSALSPLGDKERWFRREKDQKDYINLNPFNRSIKSDPAFIYYQLAEEQNELSKPASENLVERKNLISTINPKVFVYNDLSGTEKAYKYIVDNNPDITFVYQFSLGQRQNFEKLTEKEFNSKKLTGQVQLKKLANSASIGIITGQNNIDDAFSKTDPKYYKALQNEIEKAIAEINQVIQDGGNVAFSINGYGDPSLMPQELFVYLSKRLFEEFQYLNPGSEFSKEVSSQVAKYQPITDAEILAKFEGENNPLNCI